MFDWAIEADQLKTVEFKIKNDPLMKENFIGSLFKHLTTCFSEFVGKPMTLKDINDAIEYGELNI